MRKHRMVRSTVCVESLEDRSVPSLFGLGGFGNGGGHPSSALAQDARQTQQAFDQFLNIYLQDYRNVLYGADSSGNINPAANRGTFDTEVGSAIQTLLTSVQGAVSGLTANSANPTLSTTISTDLPAAGSAPGADSLQGQLQALPTPTGAYSSSAKTFVKDAKAAISTVENTIVQQIHEATVPSTTATTSTGTASSASGTSGSSSSASTPSSSSSAASAATGTTPTTATSVTQALPQVQQAISTFATSYSNDVQTILYQADSNGNINPASSRAAFDTQVGKDVATLDSSIDSALTADGATATLTAQIDAALTGTGADSLQTQLQGLPTPTGAYTLSAQVFGQETNIVIEAAAQVIDMDIVSAGGTPAMGGGPVGGGIGGGPRAVSFGGGGFGGRPSSRFGGRYGGGFGRF